MDEKKKLTVAEILALARKGDGGAGDKSPSEKISAAGLAAEGVTDVVKPTEAAPRDVKPTTAPGERPSVADVLALDRGEGESTTKPSAEPSQKTGVAPKAKAAPSTSKVAATSRLAVPPKDTASVLAAARKLQKPGPMSKAAAVAAGKGLAGTKKREVTVPPMPERPAYAKVAPRVPKQSVDVARRKTVFGMAIILGSTLAIGFSSLAATLGLWTLGLARFMFPNILREPPSQFKVGFPGDFSPGQVEAKYKAQFGVWVANAEYDGQSQLYALKSVCTHLGCTPNWLEAEQKFKCPCHGSGFYKDGINFEGPAPRPLERYAIRIADDGQVEIDKSRTYQEEMGQWEDPASYIST